jgi:TolB protein
MLGNMKLTLRLLCMGCLLGAWPAAVTAQTAQIRIVGDGADKTTIGLAGLQAGAGDAERLFVQTLQQDLARSGWFKPGGATAAIQVTGVVTPTSVTCAVDAGAGGKRYFERVFAEPGDSPRQRAHRVCDAIVEAVKRVPGIASLRVALIGSRAGKKDLYVCGMDGADLVQLTRDGAPCLAPNWYPDAQALVYTSLHRGFPDVYRVDLRSLGRTAISSYPGINAGAAISPDGREMALALSRDGNPELYVKNLGTGKLRRLTKTRGAAEASPSWSPDGKRIAYVSDSTGAPQVYAIDAAGGRPTRLSLRGSENVSPDWGPDGRIAYSGKRQGRYQICVYDPTTRDETQVTSEAVDYESPAWARNARHLLVERTEGYHTDVYLLDTLGDVPVRLTNLQGDWYAPACAPR